MSKAKMPDPNWRSNTEILAARRYCEQFCRRAVIVVSFLGQGCRGLKVVSYGRDRRLCEAASKVAEAIYVALREGDIDMEELGNG